MRVAAVAHQVLSEGGSGRGRRVGDYTWLEAQCWLDTSFHEHKRNDHINYWQAAPDEAERLATASERRDEPLPSEKPLVDGPTKN